ncbi:glycosyltransferase family 2 protein [Aeromicrobium yanjiei]|uniref:Glycosyltransferase family 2 protein n=2 Tax=Nocardioidaceae TaxID=85015 RepID=A0A5Q2MCK1_9ACTN|nr:glycosyltransferase family 2 protein [Aeromicrobium sp. S22]QGG40834.1 glycosyltransferase family 2 protein [Aeromicrobium yanjiei]
MADMTHGGAGPQVKIVATLMVRDEVDIIAAMVEHHLAQGIDLIIATDNGSVDGTREVLAEYAERGVVELHDYLVHDKNQTGVVSSMASRAYTEHGADWVINVDADEFFVPVDRSSTVRDVLARVPRELGSFSVPVTNLTGRPAPDGAGILRLTWRDEREESTLMETVALHAHPTSVVVHVGQADVVVQQGNHGVSIPSTGQPDPSLGLEVLHVPWRSFRQYGSKVQNTGESYEANPGLRPSPRHHGMRDFRFLRAGVLEDLYIVRHRLADDEPGFREERLLADSLTDLLASGRAVLPERLRPLLVQDEPGYDPERVEAARSVAAIVVPLELEHLTASEAWRDAFRKEQSRVKRLRRQVKTLESDASAKTAATPPSSALRRLKRRVGRRLTARG